MENAWAELLSNGIEVIETELSNTDFEKLFGDAATANQDGD
jgi:hypothetical protein